MRFYIVPLKLAKISERHHSSDSYIEFSLDCIYCTVCADNATPH